MDTVVQEKLKKIKVCFFDADGVFFDGQETRVVINGEVSIAKTRSYPDGQGMSFLRALGIKIVFVTGEGEALQSIVDKLNKLPSVAEHGWPLVEIFTKKNAKGAKLETIKHWLSENTFELSDCLYMGDDLNDRQPMEAIKGGGGLIVCPANAMRVVKPLADIVTEKSGGHGAIRELAEMILDSRGIDEKDFPPA